MGIQFTPDEIFAIAVRIEQNGARFYRRAAERLNDPDVTRLLLDLAAMEDEHERVFAEMRADVGKAEPGGVVFAPDEPTSQALNAWADANVIDTKTDPIETLTGEETPSDILRMAIGLEKDSIVFYTAMKESLGKEEHRARIEQIIREELEHFISLSRDLARLRGELN